jgi:hypothetical protein
MRHLLHSDIKLRATRSDISGSKQHQAACDGDHAVDRILFSRILQLGEQVETGAGSPDFDGIGTSDAMGDGVLQLFLDHAHALPWLIEETDRLLRLYQKLKEVSIPTALSHYCTASDEKAKNKTTTNTNGAIGPPKRSKKQKLKHHGFAVPKATSARRRKKNHSTKHKSKKTKAGGIRFPGESLQTSSLSLLLDSDSSDQGSEYDPDKESNDEDQNTSSDDEEMHCSPKARPRPKVKPVFHRLLVINSHHPVLSTSIIISCPLLSSASPNTITESLTNCCFYSLATLLQPSSAFIRACGGQAKVVQLLAQVEEAMFAPAFMLNANVPLPKKCKDENLDPLYNSVTVAMALQFEVLGRLLRSARIPPPVSTPLEGTSQNSDQHTGTMGGDQDAGVNFGGAQPLVLEVVKLLARARVVHKMTLPVLAHGDDKISSSSEPPAECPWKHFEHLYQYFKAKLQAAIETGDANVANLVAGVLCTLTFGAAKSEDVGRTLWGSLHKVSPISSLRSTLVLSRFLKPAASVLALPTEVLTLSPDCAKFDTMAALLRHFQIQGSGGGNHMGGSTKLPTIPAVSLFRTVLCPILKAFSAATGPPSSTHGPPSSTSKHTHLSEDEVRSLHSRWTLSTIWSLLSRHESLSFVSSMVGACWDLVVPTLGGSMKMKAAVAANKKSADKNTEANIQDYYTFLDVRASDNAAVTRVAAATVQKASDVHTVLRSLDESQLPAYLEVLQSLVLSTLVRAHAVPICVSSPQSRHVASGDEDGNRGFSDVSNAPSIDGRDDCPSQNQNRFADYEMILSFKLLRAILYVYKTEAMNCEEACMFGPVLRFCSTFLNLLPSMVRRSLTAEESERRQDKAANIDADGRLEILTKVVREALVAVESVKAHSMEFDAISELTPSPAVSSSKSKSRSSPHGSAAAAVRMSKKDQNLLARLLVQIESAKDFLFDIRTTYHLKMDDKISHDNDDDTGSSDGDKNIDEDTGNCVGDHTPTRHNKQTKDDARSIRTLFGEIRSVLVECKQLHAAEADPEAQEQSVSNRYILEQNGNHSLTLFANNLHHDIRTIFCNCREDWAFGEENRLHSVAAVTGESSDDDDESCSDDTSGWRTANFASSQIVQSAVSRETHGNKQVENQEGGVPKSKRPASSRKDTAEGHDHNDSNGEDATATDTSSNLFKMVGGVNARVDSGWPQSSHESAAPIFVNFKKGAKSR